MVAAVESVTPGRGVWRIGSVAALALVVGVIVWQWDAIPLPGRPETDPLTGLLAALLGLAAVLSALACTGSLVGVAAFQRKSRLSSKGLILDEQATARMATARRWALSWALASLLLVPFNAADTTGVPVTYAFASLPDFLSSSQTAQGWLLTAVVALVVAAWCNFALTWRSAVAAAVATVVAGLPTVVTAQVSVGAGHDWATDSAIVFTVATGVWFAFCWALAQTPIIAEDAAAALKRYQRVALTALLIALPTRAVIAVFELAGQAPWRSPYGLGVLVLLLLLVSLAARVLVREVGRRRGGALHTEPGDDAVPDQITGLIERLLRGVRADLALVLLVLAVQVALVHLAPPRFLVPQSPQQNFLGFELPQAPGLSTMLLPGRPNVLLTVVALTAITLYVVGYVRLRRRGDGWPVGRLVAWVAGWSVVLVLATTRVWMFSSATFSWHMLVHMSLNMLVPVLLVLAGPITLLLRAAPVTRKTQLMGVRDAVEAMLSWRLVQRLTHPLLIWAVFIGSFYVLYFSSLFGDAMRYHWAHQLMTFHFLAVGSLFYGLVIGVDRPPRPLPHVARLGFVFAAMPFHAFFAVGVLSGDSIIGANFYNSLDLTWMKDLAAEQQTGGQIAWATGELPLLIVIIALVFQWFRQDQRVARRSDRSSDAGHDDSAEAYNDMLAELAKRDRQQTLRP